VVVYNFGLAGSQGMMVFYDCGAGFLGFRRIASVKFLSNDRGDRSNIQSNKL